MSRITRTYPFLLGLVPVLNYAARNPDQFGLSDLAFMVGLTLAGCGLVYALAAVAARGRAPAALPAFVTLVGVAWFFGYPQLGRLVSQPAHPPHLVLITAGLAASAALVWWIARRPALLEGTGRFLTLTGALLAGWSTVQIATGWFRGHDAIERSELVRELARPIPGPTPAPAPRRDIYLIVLDEYANAAVLRERFGYDNRPFEDSLRALGFHVPRLVRSNYVHTLLSLPSMLNAAHLVGLERELGPKSRHPALPNYLVRHSRVARYLEERSYRYLFFPSQWWHSTSGTAQADVQFRAWAGLDLMRSLSGGELERTVRGASLLRYFDRSHRWEADHVRRTLAGVAAVPGAPEPTFTFAHILKPHDPYVFDRECGTLARGKEVDEAGLYIDQMECLNRLLLGTVRRILHESDVPPIILLQGDHGSKLLGATGYTDVQKVPSAAARERFGAFGAYYLPGGGTAAFGDTVTVVNVLGDVLRYYFGADLPRAADAHYLSPAEAPYDFRRVDARWLAGHDSAEPELRAER